MAIFTTVIPELAQDVVEMIIALGFTVHCYRIKIAPPRKTRYNIRVSKNVKEFIETVGIIKN